MELLNGAELQQFQKLVIGHPCLSDKANLLSYRA